MGKTRTRKGKRENEHGAMNREAEVKAGSNKRAGKRRGQTRGMW